MTSRKSKLLALAIGCLLSWGAGFGAQRWLRSAEKVLPPPAPNAAPARAEHPNGAPSALNALLAAKSGWQRALALEKLGGDLHGAEWARAMKELMKTDARAAELLLERWLAADMEAALEFVAAQSRRSSSGWISQQRPNLISTAINFLAKTNPERGWKWAEKLALPGSPRSLLLASMCEVDPMAAAKFVTAHGDSKATVNVPFPKLSPEAAKAMVAALCKEPASSLKRQMLLHSMSSWAEQDFSSALGWWRAQDPATRGATLRGIGMSMHSLAPTGEAEEKKTAVALSPADIEMLSATAMDHALVEDRKDFFARFLIHLSPTDPVKAVTWVAENLHGEERADRLDSALAYATPQGALAVMDAWSQMPQSGWGPETIKELARKGAESNPARTLEWAAGLAPDHRAATAQVVGVTWAGSDSTAARAYLDSMQSDSPLAKALARGIAGGLVTYPYGPGSVNPQEESKAKLQSAWEWSQTLPSETSHAASQEILRNWTVRDPATASQIATQVADPQARAVAVGAVTESYFRNDFEAALKWAAALPEADRAAIAKSLQRISMPSDQKERLRAQGFLPAAN